MKVYILRALRSDPAALLSAYIDGFSKERAAKVIVWKFRGSMGLFIVSAW
jgi:hypothetical protein